MSNASAGQRIFINVFLGPAIGSCMILAWALSHNLLHGIDTDFHDGALAGLTLVFALGYVIGFVPALLNGLVTAFLFPRIPRLRDRLLLSLVTGASATLLIIGFLSLGAGQGNGNPLMLVAMLGTTGAISSLAASGLIELLQARRTKP